MLQANLLKGKIVAAGMKRPEVARRIGMSASALSRKINGHQSFTLTEAEKLCEILRIETPEEKCNIFLPDASQ